MRPFGAISTTGFTVAVISFDHDIIQTGFLHGKLTKKQALNAKIMLWLWYVLEFYTFTAGSKVSIQSHLMDATRVSDGAIVTLKSVNKESNPFEVEIGLFLSSEPLASDPKNHCVPILDTLQVPDDENETIIVMPLLRDNGTPRFDTVGECVEFFRQVFEVSCIHRTVVSKFTLVYRAYNSCTRTTLHTGMCGPNISVDGAHSAIKRLYHREHHDGCDSAIPSTLSSEQHPHEKGPLRTSPAPDAYSTARQILYS